MAAHPSEPSANCEPALPEFYLELMRESKPWIRRCGVVNNSPSMGLDSAALRSPPIAVNCDGAPVAQMDRAAAFEAEGRGFESLQARQFPVRSFISPLRPPVFARLTSDG